MSKAVRKSQPPNFLKVVILTIMMVIASCRISSAWQLMVAPVPRSRWYSALQTCTSTNTRSAARLFSAVSPSDNNNDDNTDDTVKITTKKPEPQRYLQEGLFAVSKPLNWTSQDVVGFLRKMLERDARERGCIDERPKKRNPWMKVGHGGTLDPLATGVLVVGVGKKGTSQLQQYLTGSKGYRAGVTLGFQTTTLDMDPTGSVVEEKPYDHVTMEAIENVIPQFTGTIQQIPPVFSALKKDGKRLYELGRKGQTAEDVKIEPREVMVYRLDLLPTNDDGQGLPSFFGLDVECGGGTYIRSLVRDIGLSMDTVATMSSLVRTKQGVFFPEHCLHQDDWTPENIYNSIEAWKPLLEQHDASLLEEDSAE